MLWNSRWLYQGNLTGSWASWGSDQLLNGTGRGGGRVVASGPAHWHSPTSQILRLFQLKSHRQPQQRPQTRREMTFCSESAITWLKDSQSAHRIKSLETNFIYPPLADFNRLLHLLPIRRWHLIQSFSLTDTSAGSPPVAVSGAED